MSVKQEGDPDLSAKSDQEARENTDPYTVIHQSETEPESDHQASLVVIRGARLGARLVPAEEPIVVGRSAETAFQISARSVSRRHCRFMRRDGAVWVEDLESTNHTFVNDKPVERVPLRDGDHVRVGQTLFKYVAAGSVEAGYHSELYESTVRDPLTGLYNRRYATDVLQGEVARGQRDIGYEFSIVILDIDHFKHINDRYGHLAGDAILKQLSSVLSERVRACDTLARIGGEEFALLLPNTTGAGAFHVADELRSAVAAECFRFEAQDGKERGTIERNITLSAGVGAWSRQMARPGDLLRLADENLYKAKSDGRNRVC